MTNREFFTAVINTENVAEDIKAYAEAAIAKMDATNEARKNKPSKKDQEKEQADAEIRKQIFDTLTDEFQTEADIAAAVGVTGPKARAELRKLVEEGTVEKGEIKVPKKGTVKGYAKVAVEVTEAEA
jgi:Fic family protein